MKRAVTYLGCFAAICCFVLVVSRAKGVPAVKRKYAPATVELQAQAGINIGAYAAAGLPVTLVTGAVRNERGFNELPCRMNLARVSEAQSANLVLFELDPVGKLRGVESWTQHFDPLTAKPDDKGVKGHEFTLRLRHSVAEKNALVLALESVSDAGGTWRIDFTDLLQTVVAKTSNRPDAQATVTQNADRLSGDYGSNYCARGFALATYLSRFSVNGGGMPAYSCDQQERTFAIAYLPSGKTVTQTQ